MVKEFVLIERQEYDEHDKSENMDTSMLSIQQLLNAVKSRVGTMYHNKVDNLFEFLKTSIQVCRSLVRVSFSTNRLWSSINRSQQELPFSTNFVHCSSHL